MNRSLRNRLRRIEREHRADQSVRYVISPVPYGEPVSEDDETAPPMTDDECEASFAMRRGNTGEAGTVASAPSASPAIPAAACPVEVMMARSWSPTSFRKAFHIKGNDDLRWVSLTYALQVF